MCRLHAIVKSMNSKSQPKPSEFNVRPVVETPGVATRIPQGQDQVPRPLVGLEVAPRDTSEAITIPAGHYALKASELDRPSRPQN